MNRALLLTAYNRPKYLTEVMKSWQKVRGIETIPVHVMLEPSEMLDEMIAVLRSNPLPRMGISVNPNKYGVLKAPYMGFTRLFDFKHYDFVIRAEDDIVVSNDILEYFDWAMEYFEHDPDVALVQAYTEDIGDPHQVVLKDWFGPWVWGTWRSQWKGFIGPTWDKDYSTNNGTPGVQAGWDWNLNRELTKRGMKVVEPAASRSNNIGLVGTHAVASDFRTSKSFEFEREPVEWAIS